MIPKEPDDPATRERLAYPTLTDPVDKCRQSGIRHCTNQSCPAFMRCPMSVVTESHERGHAIVSLWQVVSEDGQTVPAYSTPTRKKER